MFDKEFYNGKRVLVTGADGFMGSHLTERLLEMGAEVSIFVRGSSTLGAAKVQLKNLAHVQDKFDKSHLIAGNLGNPESVGLIVKHKPQIIFHLAAEAYVNKSFEQPFEVINANSIGTVNILEASRKLHEMGVLERTVNTSSSEVYGPYPTPIKEDFILNGTSPYAASKIAADRFGYAWYVTWGIPIATIRPFNTYGPRMIYDVTPRFIRFALEGKPLTIYGDGTQTRDLSYVSDTVNGFLVMGSHEKAIGEFVNFGTSVDVSINELAEKIIKISGSSSEITHIEQRLAEVSRLCCDNTKAKELFGWKPQVSIDEGLKLNIEWEREKTGN
ncbi:dTDP-glucose 4,6-dehydratase [Candidatus Aenigmatarchaeota archaeon]